VPDVNLIGTGGRLVNENLLDVIQVIPFRLNRRTAGVSRIESPGIVDRIIGTHDPKIEIVD
jgi:hypothetical protein